VANPDGATITIEYCWECMDTLRAVKTTEEILIEYEDRIRQLTLIPGDNGVFEVDVNGKRIFSKTRLGRHAEPGELIKLIGAQLQR
jgi:selenoprotein W-related protein